MGISYIGGVLPGSGLSGAKQTNANKSVRRIDAFEFGNKWTWYPQSRHNCTKTRSPPVAIEMQHAYRVGLTLACLSVMVVSESAAGVDIMLTLCKQIVGTQKSSLRQKSSGETTEGLHGGASALEELVMLRGYINLNAPLVKPINEYHTDTYIDWNR
eukprot:72096-Pyramimonas_sp.AAC.2